MHSAMLVFWIIFALAIPVVIIAFVPRMVRGAEATRQEYERHPSLRKYVSYQGAFIPVYLAAAVVNTYRSMGGYCPGWIVLTIWLLMLVALAVSTLLSVVEARERKRLRREDAEAGLVSLVPKSQK